jgi:uncharacterized damage-inducible protein DinB
MEELIQTFEINHRATLRLLNDLTDEQFAGKTTKGKDIAAQFAHIHNVRLMWLKASAPDLHEGMVKLEVDATKNDIAAGLSASAQRMSELIRRAETPGGRIKGFKPHAAAFVGYLCAHEAFHRAHAELSLRQAGMPISDKTAYALWEWGVL